MSTVRIGRGRWIALLLLLILASACAAPTSTAETTSTSVLVVPTVSSTTVSSDATRSTTAVTIRDGPIEVAFPEGTGGLAGGGTLTTVRLRAGLDYRFGSFFPPFVVTPPGDHWEVRAYSEDSVRLRWRGETGFAPGTLVVVVLGVTEDTVEQRWSRLEAEISEQLEAISETLTWVDSGSTLVGSLDVEWRELRTTDRKPLAQISAPCVFNLASEECVWFESSARIYVVPLDDLNVTVLATEQMCDCDLGGLGRLVRDNELERWLDVLDEFLGTFRFES